MTDATDELDADGDAEVGLSDPEYYLNRELSKLAFERRVLILLAVTS